MTVERVDYQSLGRQDLIPRLEKGQRWAAVSLLKHGSLEPPNGGPESRCMLAVCMPAEGSAYYHALTGDDLSLRAVHRAVETFRKYRTVAKGHRVPYPELGPGQTIEYEMGAIHVGRNLRGMLAAADVTGDSRLVEEVHEELSFWVGVYDRDNHRFPSSLDVRPDGVGVPSKVHAGIYVLNMTVSLAVTMWEVGNRLGNREMMEMAEDHITRGVLPKLHADGYWPYACTDDDPDGTEHTKQLRLDNYSIMTFALLSRLLSEPYWRQCAMLVEAMKASATYIRSITPDCGAVDGHPGIAASKIAAERGAGWAGPKSLWHMTADSLVGLARMRRYLDDETVWPLLNANLRWLHYNNPLCIPFLPGDHHIGSGLEWTPTEAGYSHAFREVVIAAYEGIHLRETEDLDVETVFVQPQYLDDSVDVRRSS